MRICRLAFCTGTFLLLSAGIYPADSGMSSVTMPSAPSMPSVSVPEIGSGFYVPGNASFYSGTASSSQRQNQTSQTESAAEDSQTQKVSSAAGTLSSALSQYTAGTNISDILSASDISSLSGMGLFDSVSGLLGSSGTQTLSSQTDTILLQQILTELTALKSQINTAESTKKESEQKILRFIINGKNILPSCRTVYFSEQEKDGSFLLTGDRSYERDGAVETETFHLLFRAEGSDESATIYKVTPAVFQNTKDESSPVLPLAQKESLTAQRTGNLITLRFKDDTMSMDLLISMNSSN